MAGLERAVVAAGGAVDRDGLAGDLPANFGILAARADDEGANEAVNDVLHLLGIERAGDKVAVLVDFRVGAELNTNVLERVCA